MSERDREKEKERKRERERVSEETRSTHVLSDENVERDHRV